LPRAVHEAIYSSFLVSDVDTILDLGNEQNMEKTQKPYKETKFERFSNLVRGVVNVPHADVKRKLEASKKKKQKAS